MVRTKAAPVDVTTGGEPGEFEAYASVFGTVDSYGDIVEPGAFTRTLGQWAAKGETIPILWGHDMTDAFANIGSVVTAAEDEHGLRIRGRLDLDNPTAGQVYRLMKQKRTNRMSFAYAVRDARDEKDGTHLLDLDLFEVSIVQVPANQDATILSVKSADAGTTPAQRDNGELERLTKALELLTLSTA